MSTEQLTVDTVPEYLRQHRELTGPVDPESIASVTEVGDGNLNLVFIVRDASGAGVVVKQSLPHVRVDPSWPLTRARTKREAVVLAAHEAVDPSHVPALYGFDEASVALSIEDLSDHAVWRSELNAGRMHPYAAAQLGTYVGAVSFATSVFGTGGPERRRLVAEAANPELSEITEDLVFTEPYVDHEHNGWLAANDIDVQELRADRAFVREIGLAKLRFQESTQSLLHGDLHTGSVFVRAEDESVRAFDSEFGTYGPTGFDLGAVWANLILAAARAKVLGRSGDAATLLELPVELVAAFEAEFVRRWPERVDPRVYGDDVREYVLESIRSDAAIYAAAKTVRRLVGFSKVADIETLPEPERAEAVRLALRSARAIGVARLTDASTRALSDLTKSVIIG
ncbi:5-methylthioribose kinase [Microbacterium endophyticum]|uniref:S-methyl-5-thioribose kinase n=1 Tax=Microbacterium endophyticum TaxID=1526412 RepID=A0A7W4V2U9_9MICO|nr:S-methyl-5-thioribose kinase [Microbacterium endophyticum]MBB2975810.1 5-methylthioribose kinase [Microbacterium endophyticum]NIK36293.1 5-methylthioribose kinase [Microbacterium endophyticum]